MTERPMNLYRKALERLTGAAFQPGSVSFASIPARPEEDADTLLAFALDDLERMRRERDTCTAQECEELRQVRAQNAELLDLLKEAHTGLTHGGGLCAACGAEPGCDIDCPVCRWTAKVDAAIAKVKGGAE